MTLRSTVGSSLALLSRRDRRILLLVTLAQMSTAFLDLFGVLLIGIVTALSLSVVSEAPSPAAIQSLLERLGLAEVETVHLALVLAVIAGVVLVSKSVINMSLTRRVLQFLANRQAVVSGRLAAGLLSRPLLQVQRRSSQETAYALTTGVNFSTIIILGQGVVAVSELTLLLVLGIGLFLVSPIVTIFTVVFFALVGLALQRIFASWAQRLGETATDAEVGSISSIQEALRTYREVLVSNRRATYVQRFQGLRWKAASVQADLQFISLIPKYVFEAALVVGAGLLAASQLLTKDLTAAVAVIAVFLAAGTRIVPSMLRLQGSGLAVLTAAGQAEPTFVLDRELAQSGTAPDNAALSPLVDSGEVRQRLRLGYKEFEPTISVNGVWLAYPNSSAPALSDISFTVHAGGSVALVGPTGSGKSTLADVILGVLTPDRGDVLIGGVSPLAAVSTWPGGLAYVPQDVAMTNGSVRENVALGLPEDAVDDEWVWEALDRAHLAKFLRDGRQGLDTLIGEHGIMLSGGQRQRLGIARALYSRPRLLVMDEATSALDAETEQAISQTLQELEGEVTTVTIAHRLATIRHCDLVLYLEGGRIHASGSFDDVRSTSQNFDQQATLLGL